MLYLPLRSQFLKIGIARSRTSSDRGFSLIELFVVIAVAGVLATMILPTLSFATRSLPDSTNRLASSFKMARAKAMSQTAAYRLRATGISSTNQQTFTIEQAKNCNETDATKWAADGAFTTSDRQLDTGITFSSALEGGQSRPPTNGWSLCFNPQGLANKNLKLTLNNVKDGKQKQIEVFPGGAVQIYD